MRIDYGQRAKEWYSRAGYEKDAFVKFILLYFSLEVLVKIQEINMDPNGDRRWSGKLDSEKDFDSIIEFVIRTRNNLFHGEKGPDSERDLFIVNWGTKILKPLVETLLK